MELTEHELADAIEGRLKRAQRQLDDRQFSLLQLELYRAIALAKAAQYAPPDAAVDAGEDD